MTISTPILHPNVYVSGRICLGIKWIPSFGLDLLVRRIVQIVTFDPTILNKRSPANSEALAWYCQARQANSGAFPTDTLTLYTVERAKGMKWDNVSTPPAKTVMPCPHCKTSLSLPLGKRGQIKCPTCGTLFQVAT